MVKITLSGKTWTELGYDDPAHMNTIEREAPDVFSFLRAMIRVRKGRGCAYVGYTNDGETIEYIVEDLRSRVELDGFSDDRAVGCRKDLRRLVGE